MRVKLHQLKALVREELAAQAPPDAPLGQWAWPRERKLPVDEPDTDAEVQLISSITAMIKRNVTIPASDIELLYSILSNGWYSNVIRAPEKGTTIYRGMLVPRSWVSDLVGEEVADHGAIWKSANFKPQVDHSSWTTDILVASDAFRFKQQSYYAVVLVADVDANVGKLIDMQYMYDLNSELKSMKHEHEVTALGSIKIMGVLYASYRSYTDYEDIFESLRDGVELED